MPVITINSMTKTRTMIYGFPQTVFSDVMLGHIESAYNHEEDEELSSLLSSCCGIMEARDTPLHANVCNTKRIAAIGVQRYQRPDRFRTTLISKANGMYDRMEEIKIPHRNRTERNECRRR